MKRELSATMVACIDDAEAAGGELVRHQGGYWAPHGAHPLVTGTPSHGTPTANAIVARGYAEYTEWQTGRNGRYPIALRLTSLGKQRESA